MAIAPLIAVAFILCMAPPSAEQDDSDSDSECVLEDNIDYTGNDIPDKHKSVTGLEECISYCGETPECEYWSYAKSQKECFLKTSDSGRKEKDDIISATKNCATGKSCGERDCTENPEDKKHCVFELTISLLSANAEGRFADGNDKRDDLYVYNEVLVGPTLTVCQGDDVTINLVNNLKEEDTSLHIHGVRQRQKKKSDDEPTKGYSKGGPWSDGVPFVNQCPIPPSKSFIYTFSGSGPIVNPDKKFNDNNAPAGTYWYHSHTGNQRMNGAAGKLIIMPREKRQDVDVDDPANSLLLQEWYKSSKDSESGNPPYNLLVNGKGKQTEHFYKCNDEPDCNKKHNQGLSVNFHTVPNKDYDSENQPDYDVFEVDQNKKYRFRIIGGIGNNYPIRFSVEDHPFTAIAVDSIDIEVNEKVEKLDALWVAAGERYDIVIQTKPDPKETPYKINLFSRVEIKEKGKCPLCSLAWLKYPEQKVNNNEEAKCAEMEDIPIKKVLNPVPNSFPEWINEEESIINVYPKDLRAIDQADKVDKIRNKQYIHLANNLFNNFIMDYPKTPFLFQSSPDNTNKCGEKCTPKFPNQSSDDGKHETTCKRHMNSQCDDFPKDVCTNPCVHVIEQPIGKWFEIILINDDAFAHPIHQHGGWFNIIGMDQFKETKSREDIIKMDKEGKLERNIDKPIFKDVIQVPTNGYVIIASVLDNPGTWIIHCHIDNHLAEGMAMVLQIGEAGGSGQQPDAKEQKWSIGPDENSAQSNKDKKCNN